MEKVVSNSTSIICLERIKRLDLLEKCVDEVYIPDGVSQETKINSSFLKKASVSNLPLVFSLQSHLGRGESEAIALAIELNLPVMLDDKRARNIARKMGLEVVGTLSLLLHAKEKGYVKEIKPIIYDLEKVGFYVSGELKKKVLLLARE